MTSHLSLPNNTSSEEEQMCGSKTDVLKTPVNLKTAGN